ncbi:MAG TPA: sigma-70 family RNA polymerase sigma factor [Actinomycetota bacterium]|nr:sigma-70 family RNA polymerase sigma factor [Actinomycetota bacterium]
MDAMAEQVSSEAGLVGFTDFFRTEYGTLLRAMYLLTGDRYEAEELAQDAFVKACERWDRVGRMGNPTGYVYRTAVNAHRSALRRIRSSARRALTPQASDPISESDDRDRLRRALATLPANQREAIVLVEWLGLSDVEAGRVLRISPGAVRVRISRARTSLRPLIERSRS